MMTKEVVLRKLRKYWYLPVFMAIFVTGAYGYFSSTGSFDMRNWAKEKAGDKIDCGKNQTLVGKKCVYTEQVVANKSNKFTGVTVTTNGQTVVVTATPEPTKPIVSGNTVIVGGKKTCSSGSALYTSGSVVVYATGDYRVCNDGKFEACPSCSLADVSAEAVPTYLKDQYATAVANKGTPTPATTGTSDGGAKEEDCNPGNCKSPSRCVDNKCVEGKPLGSAVGSTPSPGADSGYVCNVSNCPSPSRCEDNKCVEGKPLGSAVAGTPVTSGGSSKGGVTVTPTKTSRKTYNFADCTGSCTKDETCSRVGLVSWQCIPKEKVTPFPTIDKTQKVTNFPDCAGRCSIDECVWVGGVQYQCLGKVTATPTPLKIVEGGCGRAQVKCKSTEECVAVPGDMACLPKGTKISEVVKAGGRCGTNAYDRECEPGYVCSINVCTLASKITPIPTSSNMKYWADSNCGGKCSMFESCVSIGGLNYQCKSANMAANVVSVTPTAISNVNGAPKDMRRNTCSGQCIDGVTGCGEIGRKSASGDCGSASSICCGDKITASSTDSDKTGSVPSSRESANPVRGGSCTAAEKLKCSQQMATCEVKSNGTVGCVRQNNKMVFYGQFDPQWNTPANQLTCADWSKKDFKVKGCGFTVTAMVAASYVDSSVTPQTIAQSFYTAPGWCEGLHVYDVTDTLKEAYGIPSEKVVYASFDYDKNKQIAIDLAKAGCQLVVGNQYNGGHITLVTGVDSNNQLVFYDPVKGPDTTTQNAYGIDTISVLNPPGGNCDINNYQQYLQ